MMPKTRFPLAFIVLFLLISVGCTDKEMDGRAVSHESPQPITTMVGLATSEPVDTLDEPMAGWVAFYANSAGNPDIFIARPDGGAVEQLTDDQAFDDSPALSPDGRQIVFLSGRDDPTGVYPNLQYEMYLIKTDGSGLRRLTETEASEDHPAWSPDGTRILFDADYDGDGYYEIYTMRTDGTDLTRLTDNDANDQFADWSPDGRQIAFASDRNGGWDLFIMDANGKDQRALIDGDDWALFPAWSPDGVQIAYTGLAPRSRNTDVFVIDADGGNIQQLTDSPGFDENPVWSPDGSQIAFQSDRDGNFRIYIMGADGSEQRSLFDLPFDALWPSWVGSTEE
ncbi:DPP IV N-terminal domain-containing protein [bacterium]|nr:DPP IV N-terminal domain-containing protein [bacterium]